MALFTSRKDSFGDSDSAGEDYAYNFGGNDCSPSIGSGGQRDRERKLRREIANSNERRRMQSINSGFQALKMLIPNGEGEKLSKAAILQQTSEYIFSLEQDKTRLLQQNTTLKRILSHTEREGLGSSENTPVTKKLKTDSSEARARMNSNCGQENNCGGYDDGYVEEIQKELIDLRCQLERERRLRILLEEQKSRLESELNDYKYRPHLQAKGTRSPIDTTNTKQSLDTIVQAIRHLEGEKLEQDETPTKCKAEQLASSTSDFASRRLVV